MAPILAYIIRTPSSEYSRNSALKCMKSLESVKNIESLTWLKFDSICILEVYDRLTSLGICWTWPKSKEDNHWTYVNDREGGEYRQLHWYGESKVEPRISCALTHMNLWVKCIILQQPIIILEHDALFTHSFNPRDIIKMVSKYNINYPVVSLNDPHSETSSVTPRSKEYREYLIKARQRKEYLVRAPELNKNRLNGLPGNSAYMIWPSTCLRLLGFISTYGLWPNDALISREVLGYNFNNVMCYTGIEQFPCIVDASQSTLMV